MCMRHNGGMDMSVDLSATVFCAIGFVIILGGIIFAGLTWFLRCMEERFEIWDEKVA